VLGKITKDFGHFIYETEFEYLPKEVVDTTKKLILDTIGVGLAGRKAAGCDKALRVFESFGGKGEATLLGLNKKIPSPAAAFINSMFCHALDFDDTLDEGATHTFINTLPSVLAVAERVGKISGKELLTALVVGSEICCRLALSMTTVRKWVRTATCGSFGAAAASSKILGLNRDKAKNALGIVYSQTAGNLQCLYDGGLTKRMQPAFSARAGVLSALLAEEGITGAREVFEGKHGFFNMYEEGNYIREKCIEGLGEKYDMLNISIKPYPCCRMTHSSIYTALKLKQKYNIMFNDIEKVEITVSKVVKDAVGRNFEVRENPQVDAQFSIPYTVTCALKNGELFIEHFEKTYVCSPEWGILCDKVQVFENERLNPKDINVSEVSIYLKNGNVLTESTDIIKGHPLNPLTWEEVVTKFSKCAKHSKEAVDDAKVEAIVNKIMNLEDIDSIEQLTSLLNIN
jgi:2-methylcitrate dehydratase PrpD